MIDYGLRVGSVITIDNVHIINEWFWRGLYSCIVSHLLVVSVSHHQSIHQVSQCTCTCSLIHCTDVIMKCSDAYTCTYVV